MCSQFIAAHKAILATAGTAFDKMFFGDKADRLLDTITVETDVNPQVFRLFLHHMYGAAVEVDTLSFHTLVGLYSLCMEYEMERLRTDLVARMKELVEIQTKYETVVDWLELVTKHKVDKLQILLQEKRNNLKEKVNENNFCLLLERSNGNDEYSKELRSDLAAFLEHECPSISDLSQFLAAKPELRPDSLISVLLLVPQSRTQHIGEPDVEVEKKLEDVNEEEVTRYVLMSFLEFTDFPCEKREEMLDFYIKSGVWKSSVSSA